MKINSPIIKILRKMKIDGESVLYKVIKYLYNVEKMSIHDIASVLEISISSIYNALKKKSS